MSGRRFSGQMVQIACAVVAIGIGLIMQWSQISSTIDFGLIVKILVYPLAAVVLIELGKRFPTGSPGIGHSFRQEFKRGPRSNFDYQFLAPTVKIGSYFDLDQPLGIRRISAVSIHNYQAASREMPTVEIEITGTTLSFSAGSSVTKISDRRFWIPAYSRSIKDGDCSTYLFTYKKDYLSFAAISVDHINVPAQEATLAICFMEYRRAS
jgi:hypothetical protein